MKNIYSNLLRKCRACGFVTANQELSDGEIERIYSVDYFKGEEYLDYEQDKVILQKNFRKKVDSIIKLAGKDNIRSFLEIGCAYGFFGEIVKLMLPEAKYLGLDISEDAIRYANKNPNLNVIATNYLEHTVGERFTDICMWDVIEHLSRPDQFLEKIHSDMDSGSRLWLTTGNIDALVPRIMKGRWRMIHPPTHLHYFSSGTLDQLLNRKGFEIRKISYPFIHRGLRQVYYSLFMLKKDSGKFVRKVYSAIPASMNFYMNTFDIMFVMAVRK